MSVLIYCISDIHGCYEALRALLKEIQFGGNDVLYVLGDIIDRGEASVECLAFIRSQSNLIALRGNHEELMLDYFLGSGGKKDHDWFRNGGGVTLHQLEQGLGDCNANRMELLDWMRGLPLFAEVTVNGQDFFLSHAGFNPAKPMDQQVPDDYTWVREEFFESPALSDKHCVFGHTPTVYLHGSGDFAADDNCRIWVDPKYRDKTGIDGGCVYGGLLTAFRLDDRKAFYVRSRSIGLL